MHQRKLNTSQPAGGIDAELAKRAAAKDARLAAAAAAAGEETEQEFSYGTADAIPTEKQVSARMEKLRAAQARATASRESASGALFTSGIEVVNHRILEGIVSAMDRILYRVRDRARKLGASFRMPPHSDTAPSAERCTSLRQATLSAPEDSERDPNSFVKIRQAARSEPSGRFLDTHAQLVNLLKNPGDRASADELQSCMEGKWVSEKDLDCSRPDATPGYDTSYACALKTGRKNATATRQSVSKNPEALARDLARGDPAALQALHARKIQGVLRT